jgi:hypothetical protein
MDLPTVKAAVKSWEKSFKAKNGREPTKEDIKRDPSNIGEWSRASLTTTAQRQWLNYHGQGYGCCIGTGIYGLQELTDLSS